MREITAITLAAGKGTRMKSARPNVLHEVCGTALLDCVVDAIRAAELPQVIVVVGDKKETIKDIFKETPVEIAEQHEQLGTPHAVKSAKHLLPNTIDAVIVLNGDTPLIKLRTLKKPLAANRAIDADG